MFYVQFRVQGKIIKYKIKIAPCFEAHSLLSCSKRNKLNIYVHCRDLLDFTSQHFCGTFERKYFPGTF